MQKLILLGFGAILMAGCYPPQQPQQPQVETRREFIYIQPPHRCPPPTCEPRPYYPPRYYPPPHHHHPDIHLDIDI